MPKVNYVKHARKAIPQAGIEIGQPYYWWKFRYGGKSVSKQPPKPSQLTQSEFLSAIYDINDRIEAINESNAADEVSEIISELEDLANEQEEKLSNMPDSLQNAPTGQLLQERADAVNDMKSELEDIDMSIFEEELDEPDEEPAEPEEPEAADYIDDEEGLEAAMAEYSDALEAYNEAHEAWQEKQEAFEEWQEGRESALEEIHAISYGGE